VLLGVHIALLVLVLACRRRPAVQGAIFCLGSERARTPAAAVAALAGAGLWAPFPALHATQARSPPTLGAALAVAVVYNAERLNSLASQHWRRFARQPYFDPHGVFTSAVLSAPLLVIMFVILASRGPLLPATPA
jgi:hypothetical protein